MVHARCFRAHTRRQFNVHRIFDGSVEHTGGKNRVENSIAAQQTIAVYVNYAFVYAFSVREMKINLKVIYFLRTE